MGDTRIRPGWRAALIWGFGVALVHRLLLGLWLALMWTTANQWLHAPVNFHDPGGDLPALTTTADQLIFGVWRRWDAVHYLNLAEYGYRASYPGPTVFGVLTPLGIRAFDALLPGGLDLGAMAFETLAFALALALLYRVCEVYYGDVELGPWAVATLALMPLSYLFAAPMSESVYLACVLGVFAFGARQQWARAAFCGLVATLARPQGAILLVVAAALLLEHERAASWAARVRAGLRRGWPLLVIPLGALAFTLYRQQIGLPPVDEIYARYSYVFFVNPLEGLWINLRQFAAGLPGTLLDVNAVALLLCIGLTVVLLRSPRHRKPAAVVYVVVSLLLFVSKINWLWGTNLVAGTQSFARYTVVLFPFALLIADGLRRAPPWGRVVGVGLLGLSLLAFSTLNLLALVGP